MSREKRGGQAAVEVALMLPWLVLLFAGLLDFGFYAYAFISVENAAREAVLYTSTDPLLAGNSNWACQYALGEASYLPGVATSCTGSAAGSMSASATSDGTDSTVSVTYTTAQLFPLPFLPGQLAITRTAQMRIAQ